MSVDLHVLATFSSRPFVRVFEQRLKSDFLSFA